MRHRSRRFCLPECGGRAVFLRRRDHPDVHAFRLRHTAPRHQRVEPGGVGLDQVANFIITGVLALLGAKGVGAVLRGGKAGTWGPLLIGTFGIGLISGWALSSRPGARISSGRPCRNSHQHERPRHGAHARVFRRDAVTHCSEFRVRASLRVATTSGLDGLLRRVGNPRADIHHAW